MESDLISLKELIDAIKSMRVVFGDEDVFPDHVKNSVILAINLQPTVDAVEVVRCKDCAKRGDPDECPMCYQKSSAWYPCDNTEDDGFCHVGAMMDGGKQDAQV